MKRGTDCSWSRGAWLGGKLSQAGFRAIVRTTSRQLDEENSAVVLRDDDVLVLHHEASPTCPGGNVICSGGLT